MKLRYYLILAFAVCFGLAAFAGPTDIGGTPSVQVALGALGSDGLLHQMKVCDRTLAISHAFSGGDTWSMIAGESGKKIQVCGFYFGTVNLAGIQFSEGTGGTCGTGSATVSGVSVVAANSGITMTPSPFAVAFTSTGTDSLCLYSNNPTTVTGWIS